MIDAAKLARAGCVYLGRAYSDMDCQAFVEAALRDCGEAKNLPGSNAWFRLMTWTGTPEECVRKFGSIPAGAFLFILDQDGKEPAKYRADGIGNASHIGIYTGMTGKEMVKQAVEDGNEDAAAALVNYGDGAIHSSSTRARVCTSRFSGKAIKGGWNRIGLWDRIHYSDKINSILSGQPTPETEVKKMRAIATAPNGGSVNLRFFPNTSAALQTRVPVGKEVTVISRDGDWCQVDYTAENGHTFHGYMMTDFLKFADAEPSSVKSVYTLNFSATEAEAQSLLTIFDEFVKQLEQQAGRG